MGNNIKIIWQKLFLNCTTREIEKCEIVDFPSEAAKHRRLEISSYKSMYEVYTGAVPGDGNPMKSVVYWDGNGGEYRFTIRQSDGGCSLECHNTSKQVKRTVKPCFYFDSGDRIPNSECENASPWLHTIDYLWEMQADGKAVGEVCREYIYHL